MPRRTIWDVLSVPPPGKLPSSGPGTGPAQGDSSNTDINRGGTRVPQTKPPNATGFGGGADSVEVAQPLTLEGAPGNLPNLADRMAARALRTPPGPLKPEPNELFDGLRSREAWRHMIELTASGSFTPATGTTSTAVVYDQAPLTVTPGLLRLDQFPKGSHACPVIVVFYGSSQTLAGTGTVEFLYQSLSGSIPVPLYTLFLGTGQFYVEPELVLNAPLTDPGNLTSGNLIIIGRNVGGTPATLNWRLGFGFTYVVPSAAQHGYKSWDPSVRMQSSFGPIRRAEG